jgi:hypothetical protein
VFILTHHFADFRFSGRGRFRWHGLDEILWGRFCFKESLRTFATWHRHVDFCGGPRTLPLEEQLGPHAQFGPQRSIHTEEACKGAHGLWIPLVFGWMTHIYPNAESPNNVWAGMDMHMDANTDDEEMKK